MTTISPRLIAPVQSPSIALFAILSFSIAANAQMNSFTESINLSQPRLKTTDTPGWVGMLAGDQALIATTVAKSSGNVKALNYTIIIEVRNSDGVTEALEHGSGVLDDSQKEVWAPWTIEHPGTFELRTFAISGFNAPLVLSQVYRSQVLVELDAGGQLSVAAGE